MDKTLISRNTLAERWDFDSPQSLINYEHEGILTRNPNFKKPKYYMEEILKLEALNEINPLSPYERRRLEKTIEDLNRELQFYKDKLDNIKQIINR